MSQIWQYRLLCRTVSSILIHRVAPLRPPWCFGVNLFNWVLGALRHVRGSCLRRAYLPVGARSRRGCILNLGHRGNWEPHGFHWAVVIIHLFQECFYQSKSKFRRPNLDQFPTTEPKTMIIFGQASDPYLFIGWSRNSMVAGASHGLLRRPLPPAKVNISASSLMGMIAKSNLTPLIGQCPNYCNNCGLCRR